MKPDFENIPQELTKLDRWVCWRREGGSKIPYDAKSLNSKASSTNPDSWVSFKEVVTAFSERENDQDAFSGIGLVLNGDGLVGVDMDHCIKDGVIAPKAIEILDSLAAKYIEFSPSGEGLRAFGYAENLSSGCKGMVDDVNLELYSKARYLTVTGNTYRKGTIGYLSGFKELSERVRNHKKTDGQLQQVVSDEQSVSHGKLIQQILSGDIYHDSLRDLAASMVSTGMGEGAAVNHIRALMDSTDAPKDQRWEDRRKQIPTLVNSASKKFSPNTNLHSVIGLSIGPKFKLLTAKDLEKMPPIEWRIKGVLPARGLAQIYGPSKAGKSFLAFDMACAVAEGLNWFDYRVKQAPVVYLALEGEAGFKLRADAWKQKNQKDLPEGFYMVLQPFRINQGIDVEELAAVTPKGSVVIIDTQNRAAPDVDENASHSMATIIEGAKRLQEICQGMVILVAHTGKDSSKGVRGHSSQLAAMDAAIEVTRNGDYRTWRADKVKDGKDGKEHHFCLTVKELGIDSDGDLISSCAVVYEPDQINHKTKPLSSSQKSGISTYLIAAEEGDGILDEASHFLGIHLEAWRKYFYMTSMAETQDAKRKAFERTRKALQEDGYLTVTDDIYRVTIDTVTIREKDFAFLSEAKVNQERDSGQEADMTVTLSLS